MSAPYPLVPLGQFIHHRKEFIRIDDTKRYKRCRAQLHAQGVVLRDEVAGAEIRTKEQQVCRAGEFLVAEIDAKLGGFGIVPGELDGAIVSSHYFLFEIDETLLDRRFLNYYVRTAAFRDQVSAQGSTNYAAIRPAHVLGYTIPSVPLAEQRRIVARIEALAGKIAEAQRLRAAAAAAAEALGATQSRQLFRSVDVVHWRPLGEIVTVRGGGTPDKANPFYWQGAVPWISPKDMKLATITDAADHISEAATIESPAKLLQPGCVLTVVRGMILAHTVPAAVLSVPAAINQDMKALLPHDRVESTYLCTALRALNADLVQLVERSTHDTRKLETNKLLAFEIPVPPLSEQRRIVEYLDGLQARVEAVKRLQAETAAELAALLPAVLARAFRGEL